MLKFLKDIFKKSETVEEIEEIKIEKIDEWLNQHTSEIVEDIDKDINESYEQIKVHIKELNENLELLKKAELRNDKIALRAIQIMEGNRVTYINRIKQFTEALDLDNRGFYSGKRFYKDFSEKLEELNKLTIKSYHVMQEFMADESSKVASSLKKVVGSVKDIQNTIENSPIYNLDEIKETLKEFKHKQNALTEISDEITQKRNELEEHRQSREKIEKKMSKLKKSDGYLSYKKLAEKRDTLVEDIKKLEENISNDFSVLSRPLKKHSRMTMDEKIVERYANSPILALLDDDKLKIVDILSKLKQNINEGKIELKDKQKDKALQTIEKFTKRHIESFVNNHKSLKNVKKDVDTQILTNRVNQDFNDMLYKQEHFLKKCRETIEEINNLEKNNLKMNIEDLRKSLEDKYSQMAMRKITFIDQKDIDEKNNKIESENVEKESEDKQKNEYNLQ
jgi:hypothetical protein